MPVLSALSVLHENGIGHYGISLDSLSIMENGKMKLEICIEAVRREGGRLPVDLVDGCAALEQYGQNGNFSEATEEDNDFYCIFSSALRHQLRQKKRLKEKKMRGY